MESVRRYVLLVVLLFSFVRNISTSVTHYSIPEEMKEGSVVANLASDLGLDVKTLNQRKMRLDIVANKKYLDVNKETGELYIVEKIDREYICLAKSSCYLKLEVILDNPVRIFNIEVEILDMNDNAPQFRRDVIHLDISEATSKGERFSLSNAVDPDVGSNSVKTYHLSEMETAVKAYSDMTEVPLEYDIFSDLNLYLVIGLGSVSFLLLITILVTIVLKCQKPKPSKAAPPCRNSVISERNSTIADSTLVSNDAYWYSLFLAETRKGKMVVRQPVPKGSRYIVSSLPRGTGLTDTSGSAASTLQFIGGGKSVVALHARHSSSEHGETFTLKIRGAFLYSIGGRFIQDSALVEAFKTEYSRWRMRYDSYSGDEEMEEGSVVANLATDLRLDVKTLNERKMRVDVVANKKYLDINKDTGELFILARIDREFLCPSKTTTYCFLKLDATIENPIRMFNIEVEITDINDNAPHFRRGTMHLDISESSPIGERFSLNNAADPDVGTNSLSTVETAVKAYSDMTEVPLEYDIFSDLNLYLVIGLGSVSFLLLITILVTIVLKCQKPKPSKAAPPCRNSVISERNSTIADSTLVSNDAYWYSLFLAETRKGKMVVRQPVPKGSRYIVSSLPRGTGLTDTSGSAASTLQGSK
ncbi:hypothetical protein F2P81_007593 [Scophthalmus maximus]|uniref:Cadherin domain-containing protein n=1 Tax=Scophthalmus maximus TaxID=52904 RepID=A0A6A4T4V3_SCOMX|nr:hypothetical protein F2P81_007593 [Scophthalmus maximus]